LRDAGPRRHPEGRASHALLRLGQHAADAGARFPAPHLYSGPLRDEAAQVDCLARGHGHWEAGYWVARGWDKTARMKAASVIDTVGANIAAADSVSAAVISVGGIAHAGARGVSKVEIRVDDGAWLPAQLRAPLSGLTWVLWRYDWPFQAGQHTFTVRCFEGDGTPQIETKSSPRPGGATGLISRTRPA